MMKKLLLNILSINLLILIVISIFGFELSSENISTKNIIPHSELQSLFENAVDEVEMNFEKIRTFTKWISSKIENEAALYLTRGVEFFLSINRECTTDLKLRYYSLKSKT